MTTTVVAALVLPPPTTGESLISARIANLLAGSGAHLCVINTSPKTHRRTIFYHVRRLAAVLKVPLALVTNVGYSRRSFYTVVGAGYSLIYTIALSAVSRILGYRLFLHHHSSWFAREYRRGFDVLTKVAGPRSTNVVLSEAMAIDLRTHYPRCKEVFVAHNAIHVHDSCEPYRPRPATLVLGHLSNLSLEKGLDTVLDAFAHVRAEGIDAMLHIAGPVTDPIVANLIHTASEKFGEKLVCLGQVRGEAKAQFFSKLDIFLFPSRYKIEAQPMVVLEALSHGVPAIVTPQGYTGEICEILNTVVPPSRYVDAVVAFSKKWIEDQNFSVSQRLDARQRFLDLRQTADAQLRGLASLMTS